MKPERNPTAFHSFKIAIDALSLAIEMLSCDENRLAVVMQDRGLRPQNRCPVSQSRRSCRHGSTAFGDEIERGTEAQLHFQLGQFLARDQVRAGFRRRELARMQTVLPPANLASPRRPFGAGHDRPDVPTRARFRRQTVAERPGGRIRGIKRLKAKIEAVEEHGAGSKRSGEREEVGRRSEVGGKLASGIREFRAKDAREPRKSSEKADFFLPNSSSFLSLDKLPPLVIDFAFAEPLFFQ